MMKSNSNKKNEDFDSKLLVQTNNLGFSYSSKKILTSINLEVGKGEIVGIIGSNGSGKTTLLKIIAGIIKCEEGSLSINNNIKKGFIFQTADQNLLPWKNAIDNILLPFCKSQNDERNILMSRAQSLIDDLNLNGVNNKYPNQLSGGQKQLISLIRFLISKYDLLLIDEGWSMLDIIQRENILNLILRIKNENTTSILIVSHNLRDLAYLCNRVYLISNAPGKIVEHVIFSKEDNVTLKNELLWQKASMIFPNITKD